MQQNTYLNTMLYIMGLTSSGLNSKSASEKSDIQMVEASLAKWTTGWVACLLGSTAVCFYVLPLTAVDQVSRLRRSKVVLQRCQRVVCCLRS